MHNFIVILAFSPYSMLRDLLVLIESFVVSLLFSPYRSRTKMDSNQVEHHPKGLMSYYPCIQQHPIVGATLHQHKGLHALDFVVLRKSANIPQITPMQVIGHSLVRLESFQWSLVLIVLRPVSLQFSSKLFELGEKLPRKLQANCRAWNLPEICQDKKTGVIVGCI